ncbi:hypothetical protein D9611_004990 [Ephemerocybe angulata]|uniref:Uncharacterized protein n=1 Tax=Ephemerocybe angulata TaxID=980116 RepID=A0A8H5EX44_9AGAR|nr:hypothetical protein D9611_004990 [Tulosesus angulatus]
MPVQDVRRTLRERSTYLADGDLTETLQWFRTNSNFERVVTKAAATQYEADVTAYRNDPTILPSAPESPPPAVLSAIVRLKREDYRLLPCADWKPGFTFATLRPSATAEDPNIPAIDGDFDVGWANLRRLIESKFPGQPNEISKSTGIIDWTGGAQPHHLQGFKISHRLFEAKSKYAQSADANAGAVESQDGGAEGAQPETIEFDIEGWGPLRRDGAQEELAKLKDTHVVVPIPAYDLAGAIIEPKEYETKLRGAIVRLEFYVNAWQIKGKNVFTGDIKKIRVLAPPKKRAEPDTPTTKRKRVPREDSFTAGLEEGMPGPSRTRRRGN